MVGGRPRAGASAASTRGSARASPPPSARARRRRPRGRRLSSCALQANLRLDALQANLRLDVLWANLRLDDSCANLLEDVCERDPAAEVGEPLESCERSVELLAVEREARVGARTCERMPA